MNVTNIERAWFRARPDRTCHVRLAKPCEIDTLRDAGWFADGIAMPDGCFNYTMFHIDRDTTTLDGRLCVLEAAPTWDEASCRKAWQDCEQGEGADAMRGRAACRPV
jgi:hypothetical protein